VEGDELPLRLLAYQPEGVAFQLRRRPAAMRNADAGAPSVEPGRAIGGNSRESEKWIVLPLFGAA
jgi:hypothetical protein